MIRLNLDAASQQARQDAAHFAKVMDLLRAQNTDAADEYLLRVKFTDGPETYETVCTMVAAHLGIPPKDAQRS